jgi:hypothetical protein
MKSLVVFFAAFKSQSNALVSGILEILAPYVVDLQRRVRPELYASALKRSLSTFERYAVLPAFFLLTLGFLSYFPAVKSRAVTKGMVSDPANVSVRAEEYIRSKAPEFKPNEVRILVTDPNVPGWKEHYLGLMEELKQNFGPASRLGPSTAPDFRVENREDGTEEVFFTPFMDEDDLTPGWQGYLARDPSLRGFCQPDGNCSKILTYVFLPDRDGEELNHTNRLLDVIAKGKKPAAWNIWAIDIQSAWPGTESADWPMGRLLMHWGLTVSSFWLLLVGTFGILLPIFIADFRSLRDSLAAILLIIIGFIWQRGLIGFLDAEGIYQSQESVFDILAYSFALFVHGPSSLSRIHTKRENWKIIWIIAFLAAFGFGTLLTFQVPHVVEFAIHTIFGIFIMTGFATVIFPKLISRKRGYREEMQMSAIEIAGPSWRERMEHAMNRRYESAIERILAIFARVSITLSHGRKPIMVACGIGGAFAATTALLFGGAISTETDPILYIENTKMGEILRELEKPGGPGSLPVRAYLECPRSEDGVLLPILDPACSKKMLGWLHAFKRDFMPRYPEGVRLVTTPLDGVEEVVSSFLGEGNSNSAPEDHESFSQIYQAVFTAVFENGFQEFRGELFSTYGIEVGIGFASRTDKGLKIMLDDLRAFNDGFPGIRVTLHGTSVTFSEMGEYLTKGKAENMITSNITVFLFVALLIWWWQKNGQKTLFVWRASACAIAPFAVVSSVILFSVILMIIFMGRSLDAVSVSIGALTIGVVSDQIIYFLKALKENLEILVPEEAMKKTFHEEGRWIMGDLLKNSLVFSTLLFSAFQPVRELGLVMVAVIALVCSVAIFILMSPLLTFAMRRDIPAVPPHREKPQAA